MTSGVHLDYRFKPKMNTRLALDVFIVPLSWAIRPIRVRVAGPPTVQYVYGSVEVPVDPQSALRTMVYPHV